MSSLLLTPQAVVEKIFTCFTQHGHQNYGENVTEREHALQCAYFAACAGEPEGLVVACLLHDIGHLLHGLGEDIAQQGEDAQHEQYGAHWLENYFPREIVEPIRLHVAAKRYLCARVLGYHASLSEASRLSLTLQGGPMSAEEAREFERDPHSGWAIRLRHFDDHGKVESLITPALESYRALLEAHVCLTKPS